MPSAKPSHLRRATGALVAIAILVVSLVSVAREPVPSIVSASALPIEARATLAHIREGGPFPYERDGVVFSNRERLLPSKARGYYHEYTVPTPQSRTRGARRIVCGGAVASVDECYYSDDHYRSFRKIQP